MGKKFFVSRSENKLLLLLVMVVVVVMMGEIFCVVKWRKE
jgi:hypothetical protein